MMIVWFGATGLALCVAGVMLLVTVRKRKKRERRQRRRARHLAHAAAWDMFMIPKRTRRIEYRPEREES